MSILCLFCSITDTQILILLTGWLSISFSQFVYTGFAFDLFRSLPLLLPAVEDGIFNDNWRIRQSSVELLGDLLFKVRTLHSYLVSFSQ